MTTQDKLKYLRSDFDRQTISGHLDELENWLGKLDSKNSELAEKVLDKLDFIHANLQKPNQDSGIPIAYQTQLDYVEKRIRSQAQVILNAMGGAEQLRLRREQAGKNQDAWWWYLDLFVMEKQKKNLKRSLKIFIALALTITAIIVVYQQFFAPPPEVQARIRHEQTADRLVSEGDLNGALNEIQSALTYDPTNFELLIWQGVIYQDLGNLELAQQAFQASQESGGTMEAFYLTKAYYEFVHGLIDEALADSQKLVALNPESAEGYLFIGQAYENKGEFAEAYQAYEIASELAEKSDNAELIATIKVRMGMMLQSAPLNNPLK